MAAGGAGRTPGGGRGAAPRGAPGGGAAAGAPREEPSHTMELPRLIVVGRGNLGGLGGFLGSLIGGEGGAGRHQRRQRRRQGGRAGGAAGGRRPGGRAVSIVCGPRVKEAVGGRIGESLDKAGISRAWHAAGRGGGRSISALQRRIAGEQGSLVVGVGGGRSVDAAKMAAFNLGMPFVSVPTAASHDGIASPFVSIRNGGRPHSLVASAPLGIYVDISVIESAPARLLASGCGDLLANVIAVRDWEIGRDRTGEYYGRYAASLSMMSARIVMENAASFARDGPDARIVVEALISAGVASCIAGSSRPCSGAEHLFSHALDRIEPDTGLHGEKCGIGAVMMAKLQGQDWRRIRRALEMCGAPITARQIGLPRSSLAEAMSIAQSMRPERYTILSEAGMTRAKALDLARSTGVI